METSILPITLSTETIEAIQPREMTQPAGNFAEVLRNYYLKGGDKKLDSNQRPAENPGPSLMPSLLSALTASSLPAFPDENGISSPDSEVPPTGAPSSGPSPLDPSGKLAPLPSVLDLYSTDPMAPLYLQSRLAAIQPLNPQQVNANPLPPPPPPASGEGGQDKWVFPTGGETTLSLNKESLASSLPSNSSKGKMESILQDRFAASKVLEEGVLQRSNNFPKGVIDPILQDESATSEEKGLSSSDSEVPPAGAPSSGPSPLDPSGKLASLPSVLDLYYADPMTPLYLESRLAALQPLNPQEVNANPLPSSPASGKGEQEVAPTGGDTTLSLNKEILVPFLPSNSSTGEAGSTLQDRFAASKVLEEGLLQKSNNFPKGVIDPILQEMSVAFKVLKEGAVLDEKDPRMSSPSEPGLRGRKSINPLPGEEKIDKEKFVLQKDAFPFSPANPSRNMSPKPFNLEGLKFEGAESTPLPKVGSQELGASLNQNPHENNSLAESPAQIPPLLVKGSGASFSEGGGRGQEEILLGGNEYPELSKKAVQTRPDIYGISPETSKTYPPSVGKLGEMKENNIPTPLRPENQAVFQQVGQRVIWLIRNNEERVRISLDPPDLGTIYMEIQRNKENIKTILWTDNPVTKATLETSQQEIQRIIETEGFKLEKFDVFVGQEKGWFHGRKEDPMNSDPRSPGTSQETKAPFSPSSDPLRVIPKGIYSASKYLDLFV